MSYTGWGLTPSIIALGLCGIVASCGGNSSPIPNATAPPANLTLVLSSFANPVPAGRAAFMAFATGSGFTPSTTVYWNGSQLSTSYQTSQILYVSVPASLVAVPGTATLLARDAATGSVSSPLTYAILSSAAATAGVVRLISSAGDGTPATGDALIQPAISATGRFVAFQSAGTNLVSLPVITPWANIYLADTCIGAPLPCTPYAQLISVSADGTTGGNQHSRVSTVSQDGRFVAFDSGATNLVSNSASSCNSITNCVYLRDTCIGAATGCTPRTSIGSILPSGQIYAAANPVLSPTGRYLTFASNAPPANIPETYLRDLCVDAPSACVPTTVPISINSISAYANERADPPSLSASGQYVGFVSYATNLIDPTQPAVQSTAMMFIQNTCIDAVSTCSPGISRVDVPNAGGIANDQLDYEAIPSLSGDGRYIAYSSQATNLVSQDVQGHGNVYRRDTCDGAANCTPQNLLVSLGNDGSIANAGSHQQSMSADGRFVAFTSISTSLVWGIPFAAGSWQDIYVRDTCTGASAGCSPSTVRVAVTTAPYCQTPSDEGALRPAISADGHYVAFLSSSTNLTSSGSGGHSQVFLAKTGF